MCLEGFAAKSQIDVITLAISPAELGKHQRRSIIIARRKRFAHHLCQAAIEFAIVEITHIDRQIRFDTTLAAFAVGFNTFRGIVAFARAIGDIGHVDRRDAIIPSIGRFAKDRAVVFKNGDYRFARQIETRGKRTANGIDRATVLKYRQDANEFFFERKMLQLRSIEIDRFDQNFGIVYACRIFPLGILSICWEELPQDDRIIIAIGRRIISFFADRLRFEDAFDVGSQDAANGEHPIAPNLRKGIGKCGERGIDAVFGEHITKPCTYSQPTQDAIFIRHDGAQS